MTDFVIIVAAIASLASASPQVPGAGVTVPSRTPTVGFLTYHGAGACEEAAAALTPRPGMRLVCVPIEETSGDMPGAY
jgi:hypothetical protein